jgi:hypothetical protein
MSSTDETNPADAPMPRDELVALVARAHGGAAYAESVQAGKTLAAQSKLPRLVAENLGAGFGQWSFFPEPAAVVDFALAYASPATEEDVWALARTWASDDAASRHTMMALVGRDILLHELRRIDVPKLRDLVAETNAARERELRAELHLDVPPAAAPKGARSRAAPSASPAREKRAPRPVQTPAPNGDMLMRMPKPERRAIPKPPPPPEPKCYSHPKFGEGVLQSSDGTGEDAKLTIKFESGTKTLLARYVTERPR